MVGSRIPIRIEQYQSVCTNQVQTAATSLTAEQENKFRAIGIVEFIDKLRSLLNVHGAVQSQVAVASCSAESLKQIQSLSVVANQDDLVVCILTNASQHAIKNHHLSRIPTLHFPVSSSGLRGCVVFWESVFTAGQVICQVKEIGVITQLLQNTNSLEWLTALATKQTSNLRTLNEMIVQAQLKLGHVAEDDVLVLERQVF